MNIFRKIIYILLCVLVLLLIVSFLMPRTINLRVSHKSDAPSNYLYNLANNMSLVSSYNAWMMEDTSIKVKYYDRNDGVGAGYEWENSKGMKGTIQYTKLVTNQRIEAEMGDGSKHRKASFIQNFNANGDRTDMSWDIHMNMSWPFNIMGPFLKKSMMKYFKKSMEKMSEIAVDRFKNSNYRSYKINPTELPEYKFITSRSEVKFSEMDAFFTQNLAAIYKSIQDAGLTTNAQPSALFFKWDEAQAKTEMAVAVPVTVLQDIKDLTSYHIPKRQGFVINHYGNRSLTKEAHLAMDEYFKDRNIIQDLPVMEEYVTDPLVEKDVKKWLTRIVYWKK